MSQPSRPSLRRLAAAAGTLLVATGVTVLAPATPAFAAGCQDETPSFLPPAACDDVTPPETTLNPSSPAPNAAGWVSTGTVTLTFSGTAVDAEDAGTVQTECRLTGPAQAHDWQACTSPRTYTGLADTGATPYTFSVRAFDASDRAIDFDDPLTPFTNEDEVADEDATPASTTVKVDTKAPAVTVAGGPYDEDGRPSPVLTQPRATYLLDSTEAVAYRCELDGTPVTCRDGQNTFDQVAGGPHTLTVTASDPAGNTDPTPEVRQFTAPYNLPLSRGWSRGSLAGAYDGDVLTAKRMGSVFTYGARDVTDCWLLAPSGPGLGKITVRFGTTGVRHTFNLKGEATDQRRYVIRDRAAVFNGPIIIEAATRKPVRIDALVFRQH